jgi:acyl dehydratase
VKLRDASEKGAPRTYPVPAGEELPPLERTITLDMCRRLFPGSTGYHTDLDAAKALGFRDVVVGGRVTMYYVGEVLERHFGRAWWEGGRLEVKFTNVVWPEDRLTARGVLTGVVDGRRQVELWVEKADGTVVNVSRASLPA